MANIYYSSQPGLAAQTSEEIIVHTLSCAGAGHDFSVVQLYKTHICYMWPSSSYKVTWLPQNVFFFFKLWHSENLLEIAFINHVLQYCLFR